MLQAILTSIDIVWLFAVLALLWAIWRDGASRAQKTLQALLDTTLKASESAQKAVEITRMLVEQQQGQNK